MGVSPDGKMRGQHLRDHQHGAFHRHRDARDRRQRARRPAPALRRVHPGRQAALRLGRDRRHGQRDRPGGARDRAQDHLRGARRAAGGAAAGRRAGHRGRQEGLRRARAGEPGGGGRRRDLGGAGLSARRAAGLAARLHAGREVPLHHQRHLERHLGHRRRDRRGREVDPGRRAALGRRRRRRTDGGSNEREEHAMEALRRSRPCCGLALARRPARWRRTGAHRATASPG